MKYIVKIIWYLFYCLILIIAFVVWVIAHLVWHLKLPKDLPSPKEFIESFYWRESMSHLNTFINALIQ